MANIKLTAEQKEANKIARQEARKAAKRAAEIQAQRDQKPVKEITISIEWKKSRTWGSNPMLSAVVRHTDGTISRHEATCSGSGYDKESTVIAEVFNEFLRYRLWQLRDAGAIERDVLDRVENTLPYGIYIRPDWVSYSGGIGTSCYYGISKAIGGEFKQVASGKTFDAYTFTMAE